VGASVGAGAAADAAGRGDAIRGHADSGRLGPGGSLGGQLLQALGVRALQAHAALEEVGAAPDVAQKQQPGVLRGFQRRAHGPVAHLVDGVAGNELARVAAAPLCFDHALPTHSLTHFTLENEVATIKIEAVKPTAAKASSSERNCAACTLLLPRFAECHIHKVSHLPSI
jgi:hypothetical protein